MPHRRPQDQPRLPDRGRRASGLCRRPVAALPATDGLRLSYDGRQVPVTVLPDGEGLLVVIEGVAHRLRVEDPLAAAENIVAGGGRLTAPMPGKIVQVAVKRGDAV